MYTNERCVLLCELHCGVIYEQWRQHKSDVRKRRRDLREEMKIRTYQQSKESDREGLATIHGRRFSTDYI